MSAKPKILVVGSSCDQIEPLVSQAGDGCEIVVAPNPTRALALLTRQQFAGVFVCAEFLQQAFQLGRLLQNEQILEGMIDGVVLLDSDKTILWCNRRIREWTGRDAVAGEKFFDVLGTPEILGPDFCPFQTALATGKSTSSMLRSRENRYYQVHAVPLQEQDATPRHLIVTVRDVTVEFRQQQKLAAIHQAGLELANLSPEELLPMSVRERIELLKSNIIHYTKDLLNFEVIEIRLLDRRTGRLDPLLAIGMEPEAAARELYAAPKGNGVTGFVAATGKSYLCEDTSEDPLYLEGARGAKSSLTVPLILHEEVIGTFNVESLHPRAFTESDLQFLEIFSREVAVALNTLELLSAEKAGTAAQSVEAIHSAVALPVDEILNDAVNVMERYIGHGADVVERLQRILRNARDIKRVIQKVGQQMAPAQALPQIPQNGERPLLVGRRVLVADADDAVRGAAHALLERYECIVETSPDGTEALSMVRAMGEGTYDVIIADIHLPDMSGYDFMVRLREIIDPPPLILMTGFGYDREHVIVRARQAGLKAVLYKPFRLDQLLEAVELIIRSPGDPQPG